jgi:hypothetical protein
MKTRIFTNRNKRSARWALLIRQSMKVNTWAPEVSKIRPLCPSILFNIHMLILNIYNYIHIITYIDTLCIYILLYHVIPSYTILYHHIQIVGHSIMDIVGIFLSTGICWGRTILCKIKTDIRIDILLQNDINVLSQKMNKIHFHSDRCLWETTVFLFCSEWRMHHFAGQSVTLG